MMVFKAEAYAILFFLENSIDGQIFINSKYDISIYIYTFPIKGIEDFIEKISTISINRISAINKARCIPV